MPSWPACRFLSPLSRGSSSSCDSLTRKKGARQKRRPTPAYCGQVERQAMQFGAGAQTRALFALSNTGASDSVSPSKVKMPEFCGAATGAWHGPPPGPRTTGSRRSGAMRRSRRAARTYAGQARDPVSPPSSKGRIICYDGRRNGKPACGPDVLDKLKRAEHREPTVGGNGEFLPGRRLSGPGIRSAKPQIPDGSFRFPPLVDPDLRPAAR
jgi:hypothetical protein